MYEILTTNKFKKDYNLCHKRGCTMELFEDVYCQLQSVGKLPRKYKPHKLSGNYSNKWECHIRPDWLLLWEQNDVTQQIVLLRTGTHSDLFD